MTTEPGSGWHPADRAGIPEDPSGCAPSADPLVVGFSHPAGHALRVRAGSALQNTQSSPMLATGFTDTAAAERDDGTRPSEIPASSAAGRWEPVQGRLTLGPLSCVITQGETSYAITVDLGPEAAIYGGGASGQGLNLRGRTRRCLNVNTHGRTSGTEAYLNVPFFLCDDGWAIFVHTGGPVLADLGSNDSETATFNVEGDSLDVFFILGDAPADLLVRYQAITGKPGAFPAWALGLWTSRCSYFSAREVLDVVDRYHEAKCPVDVVHVDAWQTGNVWRDLSCNWEVDTERWPPGWASALAPRGARLSLWINPYLRAGTPAGDEAIDRQLVLRDADGVPVGTNDRPDRLLVDFTSPDAVEWWQDKVRRLVAGQAADAIKTDFGEEVPRSATCADGRGGAALLNEYALLYQGSVNAALEKSSPPSTVALFSRSGTAGSQRYPCHWVGDTPSSWAGMRTALHGCLSLSMSGFAFVGADVGGFWTPAGMAQTTAAFADFDPGKYTADVDPELFVRWTQWAALSPVMRFHGTGVREPWAYPVPYRDAALAACRVRKTLMSHLIAAAEQATTDGTPMMRPMALAFPADRAGRGAENQYLLGDRLLVAPVLRPGGRVRCWAPPGEWRGLHGAPTLSSGWNDLCLALDVIPVWQHTKT